MSCKNRSSHPHNIDNRFKDNILMPGLIDELKDIYVWGVMFKGEVHQAVRGNLP